MNSGIFLRTLFRENLDLAVGDFCAWLTELCAHLVFAAIVHRREVMGLLSIIRKIKQKEKELRILILYASFFSPALPKKNLTCGIVLSRGLDNAGKTTCVKKFNGEDVTTINPTLGFDIKTLEYNKFVMVPNSTCF